MKFCYRIFGVLCNKSFFLFVNISLVFCFRFMRNFICFSFFKIRVLRRYNKDGIFFINATKQLKISLPLVMYYVGGIWISIKLSQFDYKLLLSLLFSIIRIIIIIFYYHYCY